MIKVVIWELLFNGNIRLLYLMYSEEIISDCPFAETKYFHFESNYTVCKCNCNFAMTLHNSRVILLSRIAGRTHLILSFLHLGRYAGFTGTWLLSSFGDGNGRVLIIYSTSDALLRVNTVHGI